MNNKEPLIIDGEVEETIHQPAIQQQPINRQIARLPSETKTAKQIASQVVLIQKVMKEVMKPDVHYGVIPGTGDKPSLLKAGSETLLTAFRISVRPEIHDLSDDDCVKYRVLCHGVHQITGVTLGIGVGECSTNEEKYKWRAAICDEEYEDFPEERRRVKYKKGYQGNPVTKIRQVRQEPSDLANTVLKMAKKRAQIDLTLTATGASDIFTQDVDENGVLSQSNQQSSQPTQRTTSSSSNNGDKITPGQGKMLYAKSKTAGIEIDSVAQHFGVARTEDIMKSQVNEVIKWIEDQGRK